MLQKGKCEKFIKCRKTGADYYKQIKISTRLHTYRACLALVGNLNGYNGARICARRHVYPLYIEEKPPYEPWQLEPGRWLGKSGLPD